MLRPWTHSSICILHEAELAACYKHMPDCLLGTYHGRDAGVRCSLPEATHSVPVLLYVGIRAQNLLPQGTAPEVRTYNTIINACNRSGQAGAALKVYQRMLADGAQPTATTYTALISAYGKTGQVR